MAVAEAEAEAELAGSGRSVGNSGPWGLALGGVDSTRNQKQARQEMEVQGQQAEGPDQPEQTRPDQTKASQTKQASRGWDRMDEGGGWSSTIPRFSLGG